MKVNIAVFAILAYLSSPALQADEEASDYGLEGVWVKGSCDSSLDSYQGKLTFPERGYIWGVYESHRDSFWIRGGGDSFRLGFENFENLNPFETYKVGVTYSSNPHYISKVTWNKRKQKLVYLDMSTNQGIVLRTLNIQREGSVLKTTFEQRSLSVFGLKYNSIACSFTRKESL